MLSLFNFFQIQQYRSGAIHWFWMNREAYWENFLRLHATCKHYHILNHPDVEKARKGIYETTFFIDSLITRGDLYDRLSIKLAANQEVIDSLQREAAKTDIPFWEAKEHYLNDLINSGEARSDYREIRMEYMIGQMKKCKRWKKQIERKALRNNISFEEMALLEAGRIFETFSQKYLAEFYEEKAN
jgi:hypothetical protein